MTHSYTAPWRKLALATLLGLGTTAAAQAQSLNYNQFGASNAAGTYTDLGTSGSVIATSSTDDANSAATPIGFSFSYNGASFTDFILNTNGFLKLGTAAPSAADLYYTPELTLGEDAVSSTDPADVNLLIPFNVDLEAGTAAGGTEYRVATSGVAPNRVTTIQWKNVRDKALTNSPQYDSFSFQVKLYETTNSIEFIYSTSTPGTTGADAFRIAAVGLKGSGSAVGQTVLVNKTSSAAPWSSAVFISGNYTGSAFNYRRASGPDAGRTFRFAAAPANDAAVQTIYALGKTPASNPTAIQAVVSNTGSTPLTNLAVTLNVTGANTFTDAKIVPSLAAGASTTVSFATFTPATIGNNQVVVTVPADAVTANNSQSYTQVVTSNTFSYANNTTPNPNSSVGFVAATTGAFIAKFNTPVARTISAVAAGLADPNTVGRTVYSVVVNAAGAVLGRSADYVVQTADINTLKSLPLLTSVSAPAGDFYVGLVQTAAPTGGTRYFPLAILPQSPVRPATFFTIAPFTAAGGTLTESSNGIFVLDAQTATVQGTSKALNRAVAMYPNPSTGLVKLDVRGANAKDNLQVSVTNMLGQTVHTASLKDNFTNEVNLAGLANGLYLLKVQTGAEFTTRQLTIAK